MTEQKPAVKRIEALFPVDGDVLDEYDGVVEDGQLRITVTVAASNEYRLKVNGVEAVPVDGVHSASIVVGSGRNVIQIEEENSTYKESHIVYWLKSATNKYRLSIDDNIWFLQDIALNSHLYRSIFENPYMKFLKEVHDTYGTKIHLNIYYQTDGFTLSQMPDIYKAEWQENAHWLRLTFHALQNDPAKPYKDTPAWQIREDCERVTEQIIRFAGEELLSPVTTIHFGEATRESCRVLRELGFRGLAGFFKLVDGKPVVSYYLDKKQIEHLNKRDLWKDHSEDIFYLKMASVLNTLPLADIIPSLQRLQNQPRRIGYLDLMIHEQYFYSHYKGYQPDFREKVMTAVRWASEQGYKPAFLSECLEFDA